MSEEPNRSLSLRVDPWVDLVYHALSHLPVASGDASSLFDERYVAWSARRLAERAPGTAGPPRTLPADAPLMAALVDASPQGFLLHAWPLLWDGLDGFLRTVGTDFESLPWADEERERLAAAIRAHTHPALPDLFRTALWSEVANGFERFWHETVAPRARAYEDAFRRWMGPLAERLPGLRDVAWVLCHPLRTHGRLLQRAAAAPVIAVGVADAELAVAEAHPVMQGCHEHLVGRVQAADVWAAAPWATVAGRGGYEAFQAVEDAALTVGARRFVGSRWETPYLAWLSPLFPETTPAEAAARLAAGDRLPPEMAAVVDRLAP